MLIMAHAAAAQSGSWQPTGPYGGPVSSIVSIGDVLFVGTHHNGIFRSSDNGEQWSQIPYPFRAGYIRNFVTHGPLLFAVGAGIYRSGDLGETWTVIDSGSTLNFYTICFLGDALYGATYGGTVYRSFDNGDTWSFIGQAPGEGISILAAHEGSLFFSADSGLQRSDDSGRTWSRVAINDRGTAARAFAAHDSVLVVTIGFDFSSGEGKMYRSVDGGKIWAPAANGITSKYINSIIWDGSRFIAAGDDNGGIFISDDGAEWERTQGEFTNEIRAVWSNGTALFAGSGYNPDGGIYRSTDNGNVWKMVNSGFSNINVSRIIEQGGSLFTAGYDGLYISTDKGTEWKRLPYVLPYGDISTIAVSGNSVIAGINHTTSGMIYRTSDRGASWSLVAPSLGGVNSIAASGNLVAALTRTSSFGIYRSTDGGVSWSAGALPVEIATAETYPGDIHFVGNNLFLATVKGIFRSLDTGMTWRLVNNGLSNSNIGTIGSHGNVLLAGPVFMRSDSIGIYRSTDNGDSWQPAYSENIPFGRVTQFIFHENEIIASTEAGGLIHSTDDGSTWQVYDNDLLYPRLIAVLYADSNLFVAPARGGVYRRSLISGVDHAGEPAEIGAPQLYPNPCRISATLRYDVPAAAGEDAHVVIHLVDALGDPVATVVSEHQTPGTYLANIDVGDLASGTYFCRLNIGGKYVVRPFVVLDR